MYTVVVMRRLAGMEYCANCNPEINISIIEQLYSWSYSYCFFRIDKVTSNTRSPVCCILREPYPASPAGTPSGKHLKGFSRITLPQFHRR
jgi:hypothetical protein